MNGMLLARIQFSTHLWETDAARAISRFLTNLEASAAVWLAAGALIGGLCLGSRNEYMNT
jgi:hypothetical protein